MTLRVTPSEIVSEAERSGSPGLLGRAPSWDRVMLGDVAHVVNGAAFSSRSFNAVGRGLPLIRIRDVGADNSSTWFEGPFEQIHEVNREDILVGMDGDFRVARWRGPRGLLNQRVCRLDVNEDLYDSRFLLLVLQGYLDAIWKHTSSVTVKHLSSRSVVSIPLPRPDLHEQQRIVEILEDHLSRLDAAEGGLTRASRSLAVLEASTLRDCVEGPHVPLSEVAQIQGGIQKQPKRAPAANAFPFLRVANVTKRGLDLGDVHQAELFEGELERLRLERGDLLVVEGNGSASQIGRAALWDGSIADCVHQNHLIRVRATGSLLPGYLEAVWNSPAIRSQLSDLASSSSGLHTLSVSKLKSLRIPVPAPERQAALIARVDEIRRMRARLDEELGHAVIRSPGLRRSLLSAAFSGRLFS